MADTVIINEVVDSIVIAVGGEQGPPGITDFNPEIHLIGDITASGLTGENVTTVLANTSVTAGTYGNSAKTLTITVDAKGRLTSVQENTPLLDASSISTGTLPSARLPAFSGDITTTSGSTVTALSSTGVTAGSYTKVTVDVKGRITSGSNPSTLGTFGITDAYTKTEVDAAVASATPSFSTLTGKPSTLAGYGIIDGISSTELGLSIATLGTNLKVPPSQLPSYVDSIVEYPTTVDFPSTGVSNTIYIDRSTYKSYRWSGTAYVNVGQAGGSPPVNFTDIFGKPNTLSGYGILDGVRFTEVGRPLGIATLASNGKVPVSQLPAFVDGIVEVINFESLPVTGDSATIYLVLDTNRIYRFSGSTYVEISSAGTSDETMKLQSPKTISATGDITWSVSFDGSVNVSGLATLKPSGIEAGTYTKVTVNNQGIITSASMPTTLNSLGITDGVTLNDVGVNVAPLVGGKIPSINLPSYVDDVLEFSSLSNFPTQGEAGKIYIATDTNLSYRWATSVYIQISSAAGVVSVAALNLTANGDDVSSTVSNSSTTPIITLNLPTASATKRGVLSSTDWSTFNSKQNALVSGISIKSINGVSILGSGDIITPDINAEVVRQIVFNNTGSTLTKGQVIYINGSNGTNVTVALARADAEATSSKTLGLVVTDITTGTSGYIITEGLLSGVDTSGATSAGDSVWLSSTNAGGFVFGTPPVQPAHGVYLGVVSRKNSNNGEIFVKIQNGYELNELHNVKITSVVDKNILKYDSATGLWLNDTVNNTLADIVTAGTYKSVTVNAKGLITGGTNPTTFAGYGISDTSANLASSISDETGTGSLVFNTTPTLVGLREVRVTMAANNIDLATGACFTKTISANTTLTVSNVPATTNLVCFILDLTNGGSASITWWANLKWSTGSAPTLTTTGRDSLAFFTHDNGTTWNGLVLGKDMK